jgi:protein-export membrane protein SecD
MLWTRVSALLILIVGAGIAWVAFPTPDDTGKYPFALGLDLAGGSTLTYRAETGNLSGADKDDALSSLRDVIERRTNLFGVSEPLVQIEKASALSGTSEDRLIVELPGITDIDEALRVIGETPLLEFKLRDAAAPVAAVSESGEATVDAAPSYIDTGLTGRFVSKATLSFGTGQDGTLTNEPIVLLTFNDEGAKMFEDITRTHVGERLAIFLDGSVISEPVIQEAIAGGTASISGGFTPDEAKLLVRDLNFGALPVPIELIGTGTVGATLGNDALSQGVFAGLVGIGLVILFMILWYRLPGFISGIALLFYVALMLFLIKMIPVVLTASGIAAFILSVGMAVDANVLIFERMREERKRGHSLRESIQIGFSRAWPAIRDANVTSIMAAGVLFWLGTSIVQGFALVFGLGVIISMLSAVVVSRSLTLALSPKEGGSLSKFLFGTGLGS